MPCPNPQDIGALAKLEVLDLSSNEFAGKLPSSMSRMGNLRVFNLSRNNFKGQFEPWLAHFRKLQCLDLSNNRLGGSLGRAIGSFPQIEYLRLNDNRCVSLRTNRHTILPFVDSISTGRFEGWVPVDFLESINLEVRELFLQNNEFYAKTESDKERNAHLAEDKKRIEKILENCNVLI